MTTPTLLQATDTPGLYNFRFDNSSLENFICPRKSQYHSVYKRKPAGAESALFFGGVIHEALEIRKRAMLVPNPTWETDQAKLIIERFTANPPPVDEWRTADNAIALISRYNKEWPLDAEPFTIVPGTIELPFSIPIGHMDINVDITLRPEQKIHVDRLDCFWTGRIDAIIEIDGALMVLDHKTASVLGQTYYDDFELSAQMHGYTWATRQLGHNTAGFYLDLLGNRKPSKTGNPYELRRQRYYYEDEHVEEWKADTFNTLTDFVEHLIRGYFPKQGTQHCHGKYGTCKYWDVCKRVPSNRLPYLFDDEVFTDDVWSPLHDRNTVLA